MTARVHTLPLWLAANVVFAAAHPLWAGYLPGPLRDLSISLIVFIVPAIGWLRVSGVARVAGQTLLAHVAVSFVFLISSLAIAHGSVAEFRAAPAWNVLWLLTNAGFVLATRWPARHTPHWWPAADLALGACLFAAAYGVFDWSASRVVPPQHDHDLEVQGTAVPLLTRFEPLLLTDRGSAYFFAHPPLLHFHVGASFLFHGTLGDLRYYEEGTRRAIAAGVESAEAKAEVTTIYRRYTDDPHPRETRAPNVFLASMTVGLLGVWVRRFAGRWWIGAIVAAVYAINPEVLVRSSYGGYFAIGAFLSLPLLTSPRGSSLRALRWRSTALGGALMALADHKTVLLPISAAFAAITLGGRRLRAALVHPAVIGFALGTMVFWAFGLWTNATAFVQDHVRHHVLDRIAHDNPLGYAGYPSAAALWSEFVAHTGYLLVPAGLAFLIVDLRARGRAASVMRRGTWLIYILVTAVVFTIVDWRMTKHLALIIMPLVLAVVPDRSAPRWRIAAAVVCLGLVALFQARDVIALARDFSSFVVTPQW